MVRFPIVEGDSRQVFVSAVQENSTPQRVGNVAPVRISDKNDKKKKVLPVVTTPEAHKQTSDA